MTRVFRNISGVDQYFYDRFSNLIKIPNNAKVIGEQWACHAQAEGPLLEIVEARVEVLAQANVEEVKAVEETAEAPDLVELDIQKKHRPKPERYKART